MTLTSPEVPEDPPNFAPLHAYVEGLHARKPPDRQQWLAEHPELKDFADCLDDLDRLSGLVRQDGDATLTLAEALPAGNPATASFAPITATDTDRYEILEEIGRGGMGVVFKARQRDVDRTVALKMILASNLSSPEQVRRFHAEARAAALLDHPHIVPLYDVGQMHGQPFFAMRFINGTSLAQRLARGPLPVEEAIRIACTIAQAVAYLHDKGVLHRDLKPGNILLDDQGHVYVTDFGLVKFLGEDDGRTSTGAVLGTPQYMSPEQASGRTEKIGPLSDVYSLGAILYEMLTGQPPFRGQTPLDTLVLALEGEPMPPRRLKPEIPRPVEQICLRCLEKPPEQRYPSAQALAEDLEHLLKDEPVEHQPTALFPRLGRWGRREPALASRLVALGLLAVIIQLSYSIRSQASLTGHLWTLVLVGVWLGASVLLQRFLNQGSAGAWVRLAWCAVDVILLTSLLFRNHDFDSPAIIGYPVLIAASGLWFRVHLVGFTAALSGVSYAVLVALEKLLGHEGKYPVHYHAIYLVGLGVLGYVVAYQVQRVRALSRYYEQRPLP